MMTIPVVTVGLVLAAVFSGSGTQDGKPSRENAPTGPAAVKKADREVVRRTLEANRREASLCDKASMEKFEKALDERLDAAFNCSAEVEVATGQLTNLGSSFRLVCLIALDKADGGTRAAGYVEDIVGPLVAGKTQTGVVVPGPLLQQLSKDLEGSTAAFCAKAGVAVNVVSPSPGEIGHLSVASLDIASINEAAWLQSVAVITLASDACFVQGTVQSARVLLGALAAQMSTIAAGGGMAAIADGPLPIGDAIAVVVAAGGTMWTVADLVRVQKDLVPAIRQSLQGQITGLRNSVRKSALAQASQVYEQHQNARKKFQNDLLAQIP